MKYTNHMQDAFRTAGPSHSTSLSRWFRLAIAVLFAVSLAGSMAFAQSLTITPSTNVNVATGSTQQFTATANGFTISALKWTAGSGSITTGLTGGLYTAPSSVPGQDPVTITATATSSTGTKYSASVDVQVNPPPPALTGVTPNPIPTGTVTVTATGTGFQNGATIWTGGVQMSTKFVSSTTLTASIWNPAGTTSNTFSIHNPGSIVSNSLIVPVSAPTYTLTVNNGSGGGSYAAGTVVTITANAAPSGEQFNKWTGSTVASATAATTTITMPANNATVTANYSVVVAMYTLTVVNGSGSGSYAAGAKVAISANAAPSGEQFQSWSGATVASSTSASTTLTMPAANVNVTANFQPAPPAITSVTPNPLSTGNATITVAGTGFSSGSTIWANNIQCPATLSGNTLSTGIYIPAGTTSIPVWVNNSGQVSNTIVVPVTGPPTYTLTVVNGSGSGSYTAGTSVTITANAAPAGESFTGWTGAGVSNASAATTTISMPAASTTVTANFSSVPVYALTVVGGSGSGNYAAGAVATITANAAPAGQFFINWTGASVANSSAASTTLTMPAAAATVTANFTQPAYTLTVVNGSGSGSYASGTVVTIAANAPPSGQYFQSWSGSSVTNANQPTTTVTMPQGNITVTAGYFTPAPIPFPVSSHPRLWVTTADLPRLQSWASNGNQIYAGLGAVLSTAISNYNQCFPGAQLTDKNPTPVNPYCDFGDTQGYTGVLTEENAVILAFQSLIDPNPSNRIAYAQAARNLIMYAMNQAALGPLSNAPFRDPLFMNYNRASAGGHEWPLVVDWIYNATDAGNNPILTAADKAVIQQVFIQWSTGLLTASTTGGDNPGTPGLINSLALLPGNLPYRMASNNYYLAHARNMTMMALSIDPSDDPPVNSALPPAAIGNSVRSFIADANGAWLYEEFAMMGDPAVVAAAYSVPNNPTGAGFGLASGGLPPEGFLYGESFAYVLGQLLALQTAGFNDPSLSGPQIGLIGAPVWDRYVTGYISSLTPTSQVFPSETYNGLLYQFAGYGDMLREYVTPDMMRPFALLSLLEQENGLTTHSNAANWFVTNVPEGGPATLLTRAGDPWTWGVTDAYLSFMLFNPSAAPAADPRPAFPTQFYDAPQGRIVAHSDWTPNGTMFTYKATWTSINHQDNTGGQFELFRNGEWLTKEMSNYDNNEQGLTTVYHNTLALQNWSANGTPNLSWDEGTEWTNGSQWMWAESAGDPTTITSNGAGYTYASSDLTNMYNKPDIWSPNLGAVDVTQATRSIVWLNNVAGSDFIVTYDRASTNHSGLFKQYNLCLVTAPVTQTGVNGSTIATETMNDGQQLFIQTLLPMNAASSYINGAANMNPIAELEPTQFVYTVQDPSNPASTRFLHVLQGANSGASMVAATYVPSTSGTAFDGAVFGANAVYFPVSSSTPFGGTTLPTPAGVHTVMIAGLTPGAGYTVNIANNVLTLVAGGASTADSAGLLKVTF
jgi:hypothetical protein